jgi:hypothetical protein
MFTKMYFEYPSSTESPTLEMQWISEEGRLRSVWIARQPEPFAVDRHEGPLNRNDSARPIPTRAA